MPLLTRLFIKTALIFFVAALCAGLILAARPWIDLPPIVVALNPVYFHLFMVGWVLQLIMGIAYWMFPKFSREQPRGYDGLAWAVYFLLNGGLALRVIAEPMQTAQPEAMWGRLLVVSALAQWLAGLAFVANTWPRVKEK
jgi:hypothetical protein